MQHLYKSVLLMTVFGMSLIGMSSWHTTFNDVCTVKNVAFDGGEHLVYKAYYNWGIVWIPAGEATFEIKESATHYEIRVVGKTYPAYDGFFKLRDKFYTKIDKKTLLPELFEREVNEGDYQKFERILFDQKSYTAQVFQGKTRETATRSTHNFDNCMHDLLSLLYYMRNIDVKNYKLGDFINTAIFFDKEVFPIKVRYAAVDKEKNVKELGKFDAVKVVPDLIGGTVFNEGDQMEVWVTNDSNKLPLVVASPLKIGSLKAVLKSYKGLRSPMTTLKK